MVVKVIYAMLLLAVVLGFLRGGGPERAIAGVLTAMFAIDRVGHFLLAGHDRAALDHLHLALDLAGLAAMVGVALSARRYWPLWASSCQLISVFSHLGWALETGLPMQIYLVMSIAPSALISIALIVGVTEHRGRVRHRGNDPPWKDS